MSVKTNLVDCCTNQTAKVTRFGQLVVAPIDYNVTAADSLLVDDAAVNFITPQTGKEIVINGVIISSGRNVSQNGTLVEIYQASSGTSDTIDELIIAADLARQTSRDVTGLNLLIPEGTWVNAKADSTPVLLTILYYYVPAE